MKPAIRRMNRDDVAAVHELEKKCFEDPWSLRSFFKEVENREFSYPCVLCDGERLIGYAVAWFYAGELHISNIAIAREYRRMGLARMLLKHLFDKFADYEVAYLEVRKSNLAAINLYKNFGFNQLFVRPGYYQNGEDAIVMVRYLNQNDHNRLRE